MHNIFIGKPITPLYLSITMRLSESPNYEKQTRHLEKSGYVSQHIAGLITTKILYHKLKELIARPAKVGI